MPKRNLAHDLAETVENVLKAARTTCNPPEVLERLTRAEYHYVLPNDLSCVLPLIGHFQDQMDQMKIVDQSALIPVGKLTRTGTST